MSSPANVRLFVAASIPDACLDWVQASLEPLRELWPAARWIPRDSQHVTLKFLGSTSADRLDAVRAACETAAASHSSAPVALAALGVFPSSKRARVLWVGLQDETGLLRVLAASLDLELAPLGFEPEKRPYSPHLTVARFRTPAALGQLPQLSPSPGPFPLGSFDLWRSHLSSRGARYERLAAFELPD